MHKIKALLFATTLVLSMCAIAIPVRADTHIITVGELYCWDSVQGESVGIDPRWSGTKTVYVDLGDVVVLRTQYYFRDWTDTDQTDYEYVTFLMAHAWGDLDRREIRDYLSTDNTEEGLLEYTLYCDRTGTHIFYLTIYAGYMDDAYDYYGCDLIIIVS